MYAAGTACSSGDNGASQEPLPEIQEQNSFFVTL